VSALVRVVPLGSSRSGVHAPRRVELWLDGSILRAAYFKPRRRKLDGRWQTQAERIDGYAGNVEDALRAVLGADDCPDDWQEVAAYVRATEWGAQLP
jgi:hypothetical protein